jgi:choline kinase
VAIVVGYEKEQIINRVMSRTLSQSQRFHFIENPAFAITNNIYSLWLGTRVAPRLTVSSF